MKHILGIYTILLSVLIIDTLDGQSLSVFDEDGAPIGGAVVYCLDNEFIGVTDYQGLIDMSRFGDCSVISISALGYVGDTLRVENLNKIGYELRLSVASLDMKEVVVATNRWEESPEEITVKVTSISPQLMRLRNPQTAADLLGSTGHVYIQKSQQGGGSPMIRGFSTSRLLYAVDGVRMNTAIFRSGNIQNVISLDPFSIERTEVLFGPGAVAYGSDAIGGVMSFSTLRPKLSSSEDTELSGHADARYASANNERTIHADINIAGRKWAALSSITYTDYDDLKMGSHGPDDYLQPYVVKRIGNRDTVVENVDPRIQTPSGYDQLNLMQKVRFRPSPEWDINYGFHFSETSSYGRYDRHQRMRNGRPRYALWDYGPQRWMMNHINVKHSENDGFYDKATLGVSLQRFEESRITRDFGSEILETQEEKVDAYSLNLDFAKDISRHHDLYYGVEWVRNNVHSRARVLDIVSMETERGQDRYPQSEWSSYGVYVMDQYKLNKEWILNGGLRFNYFVMNADFSQSLLELPVTQAELAHGAMTFSLGANFQPEHKWLIRSNVSTAFRAPNVDDIGKVFDSEPGAVVVPNTELKSEYAINVDFGVGWHFLENWNIDMAAYFTYLDDAIVRRDYTLLGQEEIVYQGELSRVQALQNASYARIYGMEMQITGDITNELRFRGVLNIQHGEEELDNGEISPTRHAAPMFGRSFLTYQQGNIVLEGALQYCDERMFDQLSVDQRGRTEIYALNADGNPWSPSWYTLDFRAQYLVFESIRISASVENLTDQRYRPYSSGISGAGRNYVLSIGVLI